MKLFKLYLVIGLILLMVGFTFDFIFVQSRISASFKNNPTAYLNSFEKQLYDLTKFYMVCLGFLNIALALIVCRYKTIRKIDWVVFSLLLGGSLVLLATGFWYASAGPSFKWELRCTVLTLALSAILSALALEIYRVISRESFKE